MISFCAKWLLLFLSVSLVACGSMREEVIPEAITEQSGKLVVNCFISPQDTLLTAKITRSRPVLDDKATQRVEVSDALVSLSDGTTSIRLVYNPQLAVYAVKAQQLTIRAGRSYTLTVRPSTGQQVTATTTVPSIITLNAVRLDSSSVASGGGSQKACRVVGIWQNTISTYYRVTGVVRSIDRTAPAMAPYGNPESIRFTLATNSLGLLESQNEACPLSVSALLDEADLRDRYRSVQINLNLSHVDEAYYRYHMALDQQLKAAANPFAEPVAIPSNIQDGLGCFGSYNQSAKQVLVNLTH